MAASSSSTGPRAQNAALASVDDSKELPKYSIHGAPVNVKNTFLQCDLPNSSSSSGSMKMKRGKGSERRERSAPPSYTSSSISGGSSGSSQLPGASEEDSIGVPLAGEQSDESLFDENAFASQGASETGSRGASKRRYNICKNKRMRIIQFEEQVRQQIVATPDIDIESLMFKGFFNSFPHLVPKLKERFCEFKERVLRGENPDPAARHPSSRRTRAVQVESSSSPDPAGRQRSTGSAAPAAGAGSSSPGAQPSAQPQPQEQRRRGGNIMTL